MNADKLRRLSKEATPGPWTTFERDRKLYLLGPQYTDELSAEFYQGTFQPHPAGQPRERDTALIVYLRNHANAIADLIKAAGQTGRLRGFVVGHSWPLEMMPEVMAAERELDQLSAALDALEEK